MGTIKRLLRIISQGQYLNPDTKALTEAEKTAQDSQKLEGAAKEAITGKTNYKPFNGSNYHSPGLDGPGLDEFYRQQQNNGYGGAHHTQKMMDSDSYSEAIVKADEADVGRSISSVFNENTGQTNVPEWTPDESTVENEYSYKDDSTIKTKTTNYYNKNGSLNQKVVVNSNGERSVERYDNNTGDTVFDFYRDRNGEVDISGYNKNGQTINVEKHLMVQKTLL